MKKSTWNINVFIQYLHLFIQSQHMTDIKTSVLYVSGKPNMVTLDYLISTGGDSKWVLLIAKLIFVSFYLLKSLSSEFRLSYYPHRLAVFKNILKEIFGPNSKSEIYGDFKSLDDASNSNPAFYIHVVEKF